MLEWCVFFHTCTFVLFISLYSKWVFYRQHIIGSCCLIQLSCLLIVLRSFTFHVIIDNGWVLICFAFYFSQLFFIPLFLFYLLLDWIFVIPFYLFYSLISYNSLLCPFGDCFWVRRWCLQYIILYLQMIIYYFIYSTRTLQEYISIFSLLCAFCFILYMC